MMDYALSVFIGRFQPFHHGHLSVIRTALAHSDYLVILCGSINAARSLRNPFTFAEREKMIRSVFSTEENARIRLVGIEDYPYDDAAWTLNVQEIVRATLKELSITRQTIALVGYHKDASSFYLDLFPEWSWIGVDNFQNISATPIRTAYLRGENIKSIDSENLPQSICEYLHYFQQTPAYSWLKEEQRIIDMEKQAWNVAPYPPIFTTTDALVQYGNEILLIERGYHPGKGLWALPGGFLEENELIFHSCLRELSEETGIIANPLVWKNFLVMEKVYSAPGRSPRGRIITHVFYFRLRNDIQRPVVQGGDDAVQAFWKSIDMLDAKCFHDDHFHIIYDILQTKSGYN